MAYGKSVFTLKNILLYLVVGGILYAIIYYVWIAKSGGYNSVTAPYAPSSATEMTVPLDAQNSSGETGTAVLTDVNGKTRVVLSLTGAAAGVTQPAHIHLGACPFPGAVKYPLSSVVGGASETVLDVPLSQLKSELPLAVNVHKSAAEASIYVSCGDLK